MDPFYVFVATMLFLLFILFCVIANQIKYYIHYKEQCKTFDQIAIGERYKNVVFDTYNPFDPPVVCYYKVTDKKIHNGIRYIQLESELSGYRKSEDMERFFERYTKCDRI